MPLLELLVEPLEEPEELVVPEAPDELPAPLEPPPAPLLALAPELGSGVIAGSALQAPIVPSKTRAPSKLKQATLRMPRV
jgi:hypothetical protein